MTFLTLRKTCDMTATEHCVPASSFAVSLAEKRIQAACNSPSKSGGWLS